MAYLTKVRTAVALHPRRRMIGMLEGAHRSVERGRSLHFDDLRPYIPGDEVADIDWRATARCGDLLVKQYLAERHQTVVIIIPTGAALACAATEQESKAEVACLTAGLFAWLALHQSDRVCLITADGATPLVARPSGLDLAVERMLVHAHDRCSFDSPEPSLAAQCAAACHGVRAPGKALVILDDGELDEAAVAGLRRLAQRRSTVAVTLIDPDPTATSAEWTDREGRALAADFLRDQRLIDDLRQARSERTQRRTRQLAEIGIRSAEIGDSSQIVTVLLGLLWGDGHAA